MNSLDIFVQNYFITARTSFATEFLYTVTTFFDVTDLSSLIRFSILVLCVTILIFIIRNKKYSLLFLFSLLSVTIITLAFKYLFGVDRPIGGIVQTSGLSFPSFHSSISTTLFVMLMYIFDDHMGSVKRVIFNAFCIISIIFVALSRVYLGVHWLSDVFGGIVLGVLICLVSIKIFKRYNK